MDKGAKAVIISAFICVAGAVITDLNIGATVTGPVILLLGIFGMIVSPILIRVKRQPYP